MKKRGFTLIELLASITIIVVLAMISVPFIMEKMEIMNEKNLEHLISTIEENAKKYVIDEIEELKELEENGYIYISLKTLLDKDYIEGNLENAVTGEKISINDKVYITVDFKKVVRTYYDPFQNENPKIYINGKRNIKVKYGTEYIDYGVIAHDKKGNDLSSKIIVENNVNTAEEGEYKVIYKYKDTDGTEYIMERNVLVTKDFIKNDLEKPMLHSNILEEPIEIIKGDSFTMPIVYATDNVDGTINNIQPTFNNVDINETGTYQIKYNFTDSSGNKADTLIIKVIVKE